MKRKLIIAGIAIGAILALGPVWGSIGAFWGARRASALLNQPGISDYPAFDSTIGAVLLIVRLGLIACPIGLALCIFSIFKFQAIHRRPPPLPMPARGTADLKE